MPRAKARTRARKKAVRAAAETSDSDVAPSPAPATTRSRRVRADNGGVVDVSRTTAAGVSNTPTSGSSAVSSPYEGRPRSVSPRGYARGGRERDDHMRRPTERGRQRGSPIAEEDSVRTPGESYSCSPTVQINDKKRSSRPAARCQSSPNLQRVQSTLKVPQYDGQSSLRGFLYKFRSCKAYYGWSSRQSVAHLTNALVGRAQQVLYQLPQNCSEEQVIDMLTETFEGAECVDHYRQLLRNRRQARGESLESYFLDLLHISNLAYPNERSELFSTMMRDIYRENLFDFDLRAKLMESEATNIYQIHKKAMRLQSISQSLAQERRYARALKLERSEEHDNEDQIKKLEERLDALAAKMQRQEKSDRTATPIRDRPGLVSQQQPATMEARKEITEKNGKNKKCYNCSSQLHLWAQCPERKPTDRNRPWQQARVNQLTSLGAHFYVPTLVHKGGQSFHTNFLLDTGSNAEIVPEYFSKWSTSAMKPVKTRVYSASGQEIPITGAISLDLTIGNTRMTCQFLCSPYITEAILGIQWLLANKAIWQIAEGTLSIRGHTVELLHSPESNRVRRIYAAEDVKVPPLHVCLIPIRMPRDNVSGKPACWSTEARAIGNKLLAPRCLLNDQTSGFLEVANPVAQPAYIRKNALLGKAIYVALENANLAINDNDDRRSVNQLRQQGAAPAENGHADQASAVCTAAAQQTKARDASALVSTSSENNLSEEQQKIIDQMLKTVDAEVGEEIKGRIRQILVDKIQAFSCHSMDIGTFADFQLKLQLKDPSAAPVRAPQFRLSSAQEAVIENHVQELMAAKILVPAVVNCRWSSNLLAVPKPATITILTRMDPRVTWHRNYRRERRGYCTDRCQSVQ
jgi:hypothetical protein